MTCCPTSTKGGNLRRSIDTRPCRRSKTSRLCVGNLSSFTASAVTRSATNALTLVTGRIGYDVSGYPLDGPVPPPPPSEGGRTFHRVLYDMARRQNMTLREPLQPYCRGARPLGHLRHPNRDCRHPRRVVRRGCRRWLQHIAGLFPWRIR